MKNSKKDFGIAGQSTTEAKKPHKHDANLQKNSTLYFQIGLILCLLGTYSLFEMQFQDKKIVIDAIDVSDLATIDVAPPFVEEVIELKKPEPKIDRSSRLIDEFEVKKDDAPDVEVKIFTPDAPEPSNEPAKVGDIEVLDVPVDLEPIPFARIEKVPVYPGCERKKTNSERKKCMSDKITKLINRKFNVDIGSEYGISGVQKIATQFTIDKNGNVTDIKIRGPHHALEKEAERIINKIPKMEPGLQRNVPVGVIYTLPIKFQVRD